VIWTASFFNQKLLSIQVNYCTARKSI